MSTDTELELFNAWRALRIDIGESIKAETDPESERQLHKPRGNAMKKTNKTRVDPKSSAKSRNGDRFACVVQN